MDPYRPTVDEERAGRPKSLNELLCRLGREAEQVNDGVWLKRRDSVTEITSGILGDAIYREALHASPLRSRHVRLAGAAAYRDYFTTCAHQARHQVGPDVACAPHDDDPAHVGATIAPPLNDFALPSDHGRGSAIHKIWLFQGRFCTNSLHRAATIDGAQQGS
jgi:hypothetical protein